MYSTARSSLLAAIFNTSNERAIHLCRSSIVDGQIGAPAYGENNLAYLNGGFSAYHSRLSLFFAALPG